MFELLGLVVHFVPAVAHDADEEQLDDPMAPDDERGELLARLRERDAGVGLVFDQPRLRQRLDHRRGRPGRHAERRGQLAHGQQPIRGRQRADAQVDGLQIVLDGAGRQHFRPSVPDFDWSSFDFLVASEVFLSSQNMWQLTRRSWLRATGLASLAGSIVGGARMAGQARQGDGVAHHPAHDSHVMGTVGRVAPDRFNPATFLHDLEFQRPAARGAREVLPGDAASRRHAAARVRDLRCRSRDRNRAGIVLSGVDLQRPGARVRPFAPPKAIASASRSATSAATRTRCTFTAGIRRQMDGALAGQEVQPGETFVYEFDADPFGLHLYHCHTVPLKRHIHKGLVRRRSSSIRGRPAAAVRPPTSS